MSTVRRVELLDGMKKASPKGPLYSCSGHRNMSRLFRPIYKAQSPQNFSLSRERNGKTHRAANAHHLTNTTWEQPCNQGGKGFCERRACDGQKSKKYSWQHHYSIWLKLFLYTQCSEHIPVISNVIIGQGNPGTRCVLCVVRTVQAKAGEGASLTPLNPFSLHPEQNRTWIAERSPGLLQCNFQQHGRKMLPQTPDG